MEGDHYGPCTGWGISLWSWVLKNMDWRFGFTQRAQRGDHSSSILVNALKVHWTEYMSTKYATVSCSRTVLYAVNLELHRFWVFLLQIFMSAASFSIYFLYACRILTNVRKAVNIDGYVCSLQDCLCRIIYYRRFQLLTLNKHYSA